MKLPEPLLLQLETANVADKPSSRQGGFWDRLLATGTGKSYVLYGIAAILLAHGAVDRILLLCPSTTIETGLLRKFRDLAADCDLRDLMPKSSKFVTPRIIDGSETITEGCICIENYHAILERTGSSIRDSLRGKGEHVAVLNDETHHVANESDTSMRRWKEFLTDPEFGFRIVLGVSGTCYVGNEYFSDVIYRYSLRQAMEQNFIKRVDHVADMPRTASDDEQWQIIRNKHEETKRKLRKRGIRPLTIVITPTIVKCKDVTEELKGFLIDHAKIDPDDADTQVLCVYNGAPDVMKLAYVDLPSSKVEWIVSVSMLNEGWDVKRVFQIVPHEERAFNSRLLINQVLGRGLRIPDGWKGEQPEVTVFNHDAWAPSIRLIVNEILELEKRVFSRISEASSFHFDLLNIDYSFTATSVKKPTTEYKLLSKGYVEIATETPAEDVVVEFERSASGELYKWHTKVEHRTYTPREIAEIMYERLEEADDPDDSPAKGKSYTEQFPIERLEHIVKESLKRRQLNSATDSMKQKFLQALGTLRRRTSENVRYTPVIDEYRVISTKHRQNDSVSASDLRKTKAVFFTDKTHETLTNGELEFWREVSEPGSGFKAIPVSNYHDFKTPQNLVIADSDNEKRFISALLQPANVARYKAWIKSTGMRFYDIEYSWKRGTKQKWGRFSPDFFIVAADLILVVEIKGQEELREPSPENRKKNDFALAHFDRINQHLKAEQSALRYKFNFLTESSFNKYFQALREENITHFQSELDIKLLEDE